MSRALFSPALLATELALPRPVSRDTEDLENVEGCSPTARVADAKAFRKTSKAACSPYQALPIQGPLVTVDNPEPASDHITHHLTPALPVLEPEDGLRKV